MYYSGVIFDFKCLPCYTDNPFKDAQTVWHMATPTASENYPVDLAISGNAHLGERLTPDEYAESIKRGGDGLVAVFEGGWFSLDTHRARRLRPLDDAFSLYVRAWIDPKGNGSLFFFAHSSNWLRQFVNSSLNFGSLARFTISPGSFCKLYRVSFWFPSL